MERSDFYLADVVAFFFVSAASRKSYLAQLGMRKRSSDIQGQEGGWVGGAEGGGRERESDSLFTRTMKGVPSQPLYRRRRSDKLLEFIRGPRF